MVATLTEKLSFIKKVFGSYDLARNEKNLSVHCDFCKKQSNKKKLSIHLDSLCCHCWVCGYKSRNLFLPIRDKYPSYLQEYLDKFYVGNKTELNTSESGEVLEKIALPKDFCLLANTSRSDPDFLAAVRYLDKRNLFTSENLWMYKFGISNELRWKNRVIIPSFDGDGNVNYFVARAIHNKTYPKYDMPDYPKNLVVFNELYIDWKKRLVLCEGPFDYVKCGDNAVPLLGSDLNEDSVLFEKIVLNETPIALALDRDMRYSKTHYAVKKLERYNIDVKVIEVDSDPGDMTTVEFQRAFKKAKQLDWLDRAREKLNIVSRPSLVL